MHGQKQPLCVYTHQLGWKLQEDIWDQFIFIDILLCHAPVKKYFFKNILQVSEKQPLCMHAQSYLLLINIYQKKHLVEMVP